MLKTFVPLYLTVSIENLLLIFLLKERIAPITHFPSSNYFIYKSREMKHVSTGDQPHLDFLFKALCDSAASENLPARSFAVVEVFSFRLGSRLKLINAIRSWCLRSRRWLFHRRFFSRDYWPTAEIYSESSQLSSGDSISSKNDPSFPRPSPFPRQIAESDGEREKRFKPSRDFFQWKISGFLIQALRPRVLYRLYVKFFQLAGVNFSEIRMSPFSLL